jgi:hypothetical protein
MERRPSGSRSHGGRERREPWRWRGEISSKEKKEMEREVASGATAANAQLTAQSNGMAHKGCNIKTSGIEGISYFSMAHRG